MTRSSTRPPGQVVRATRRYAAAFPLTAPGRFAAAQPPGVLAGSSCEPPARTDANPDPAAAASRTVGAAVPGRRVSLPDWAWYAPDRCVLTSNASGTYEIYAFDAAGTGRSKRCVSSPTGRRARCTPPSRPDGRDVWWFADTDGDEFGVWQVQPWDGSGEPRPAAAALKPGWPAGLAIALRRHRLRRDRSDDDGSEIWRVPNDGGEPVLIYSSRAGRQRRRRLQRRAADLRSATPSTATTGIPRCAWSRPDGAARRRSLGRTGKGTRRRWASRPVAPLLLVGHERRGRPELLVWDGADGDATELTVDLSGELDASWYVEGDALAARPQRARPLRTVPSRSGGADAAARAASFAPRITTARDPARTSSPERPPDPAATSGCPGPQVRTLLAYAIWPATSIVRAPGQPAARRGALP